jgi:hypothetical protein
MKTFLPNVQPAISPKPKAKNRSQVLSSCLIFLSAFSLAALGIKQVFPNQTSITNNIGVIDEKLDFFAKNKDQYNVLFVGSSRVYRHISPHIFDASLKAEGHTIKSFNFGILAMKLPETDFWLKRVLAMKPANVKYVFVEVDIDSLYSPIENAQSSREIYWHTPEQTAFSVGYTLGSNMDPAEKGATVFSHVLPFFYNSINLGRVSNLLVNVSGTPIKVKRALGPQRDGFTPLDLETNANFRQRQRALQANVKARDGAIAQLRQDVLNNQQTRTAHLSSSEIEFIQQTSRRIEAIGAKPIFIITPRVSNESDLLKAAQDGHIKTLFAFNNPVKYPELYRLDQQFDEEHLNSSGAEKFTRLLAERFANTIETAGAKNASSQEAKP